VCAAALATLGLSAIETLEKRAQRIALSYFLLTVVVAFSVGGSAFAARASELNLPMASQWGLGEAIDRVAEIARSIALAHAIHAVIAAGLLAAAMHLKKHRAEAIAAIVAIDLAVAATYVVAGFDLETSTMPASIADRLRGHPPPPYFVVPAKTPPKIDLDRGDYGAQAQAAFARRGQIEVPGARRFQDLKIDGQSNTFHAGMYRLALALDGPSRQRLLERAGVRYVIDDGELESLDGVDYVHVSPRFRAFDPKKWRAPEYQRFLDDPTAPETALVEYGPSTKTSSCAAAVEWKTAGPNGPIDATVRADCETWIVLREVVKRGWVVTIDDADQAYFGTDAGFIGAPVPPGEHRVRFTYESIAEQWALMSAVALFAAVLAALRRPRQEE
jgi:hypothetical protein